MRHKDIQIGDIYQLTSIKRSNHGCSNKHFKQLLGKEVIVIDKYNDYKSKNSIRIQGRIKPNLLVSIWCSPYDLKAKGSR